MEEKVKTSPLELVDAESALVRVVIDGEARECRLVTGAFRAFAKEKGITYLQLSQLFAKESIDVIPRVLYHALVLQHGDVITDEQLERWVNSLTFREAQQAMSAFTIAMLGNAEALPTERV